MPVIVDNLVLKDNVEPNKARSINPAEEQQLLPSAQPDILQTLNRRIQTGRAVVIARAESSSLEFHPAVARDPPPADHRVAVEEGGDRTKAQLASLSRECLSGVTVSREERRDRGPHREAGGADEGRGDQPHLGRRREEEDVRGAREEAGRT